MKQLDLLSLTEEDLELLGQLVSKASWETPKYQTYNVWPPELRERHLRANDIAVGQALVTLLQDAELPSDERLFVYATLPGRQDRGWHCIVCGARERGPNWKDKCRRGHKPCRNCGKQLAVKRDGSARVHARCPESVSVPDPEEYDDL